MPKTIVMSLGGSLICPGEFDFIFLKKLAGLIKKSAKKNRKFIIICGGGKLARSFQEIASKNNKLSNEELDWLGIHATKVNAHIVKSFFGKNADGLILSDPTEKLSRKKNIIVASGWKPGWSTDYDAVLLAKNAGAKEVINMSNTDYVYDKDPRKNKGAKRIENIGWHDYRKLSGNVWKAGMSLPFDPIAAKEAQKSKIKVYVIGKDLGNLQKLLENKKFKGTVIQ